MHDWVKCKSSGDRCITYCVYQRITKLNGIVLFANISAVLGLPSVTHNLYVPSPFL